MKDNDPMQSPGGICAVVVTYNRKRLLEQCLTALLDQTRPLDEIIVIDNASTDGTEDVVRERFPGVTYVKLASNSGGAGGFHEGIKLAFEKGYDWIWIMDDDAIAMANALENLTNCPMMLEDKVYALASTVLERNGSISLLHRRLFDPKELKEEAINAGRYKDDYFQMDSASFVGLLISRKAIREIGLPLKDLFIYYDDTEYSLRIRKRGIMVTVPGSKIVHGEGDGGLEISTRRQQPLDWRRYYATRNRIYMLRKHGQPGLIFYRNILRTIYYVIKEALLRHHFKFRSIKILFFGILDGLRGKLGKNGDFTPD
jgi:rhamnopyranosyl-N-acetylglucosaminyl-diphospho-decaprenol beta-1,3/1,4-galactofuranosyltransferase